MNGREAACHALRRFDTPLDELREPFCLLSEERQCLTFDLLGEERDANEELPETVMEVSTDVRVDGITRLDELSLVEARLGEVPDDERESILSLVTRPREGGLCGKLL